MTRDELSAVRVMPETGRAPLFRYTAGTYLSGPPI